MGMFDKQESYESSGGGGGDSVFDRVANAEEQEGASYPEPGVYPLLMVDTIKMIKSRKGDDLFIAEFEILQSDVSSRPVGSRMQYVANFRHDPTPSAVKAFFTKLTGSSSDEVTSESLKFAVGEKQPCKGRLVRMEATQVKTKSDRDFTKCTWVQIPSEMQKNAEKLREEAGFPPF
jgi:hypothetical protein